MPEPLTGNDDGSGGDVIRRLVALTFVASMACLVATAGWLVWSGLRARSSLEMSRSHVQQMRTDLVRGNVAAARADLRRARIEATRARRLTSGPVWSAASALPLLGHTPRVVAGVASAGDQLASGVLPQLLDGAAALLPTGAASGRLLDPDAVRRAQEPLRAGTAALADVRANLSALPTSAVLGQAAAGKRTLLDEIAKLGPALRNADSAARLLPSMLGAAGPRRYFVALQNNAEARGTGGLLGGYGILQVEHGRVRLLQLRSDLDLGQSIQSPVDLGPDFRRLYGADPALWANANESAHFPYAAQLWLGAWHTKTGRTLDGVIGLDPVALSYLLAATGPTALADGERVSADNVVDLMERDLYARFPGDDAARKRFLVDVGQVVASKVLDSAHEPSGLLHALMRAAGERRLAIYSSHAQEERLLAGSPVGGAVPDAPGPFLLVSVVNGAGNKLDYYLHRTVHYRAGACADGSRSARVTVQLANAAPVRGLPPYVLGPAGDPRADRELVYVYLGRGARLVGATSSGGHPVEVVLGREQGHPVVEFAVVLPPGQERRVDLDLVEPASAWAATVPVQPLVVPQQTEVDVAPCRGP